MPDEEGKEKPVEGDKKDEERGKEGEAEEGEKADSEMGKREKREVCFLKTQKCQCTHLYRVIHDSRNIAS